MSVPNYKPLTVTDVAVSDPSVPAPANANDAPPTHGTLRTDTPFLLLVAIAVISSLFIFMMWYDPTHYYWYFGTHLFINAALVIGGLYCFFKPMIIPSVFMEVPANQARIEVKNTNLKKDSSTTNTNKASAAA